MQNWATAEGGQGLLRGQAVPGRRARARTTYVGELDAAATLLARCVGQCERMELGGVLFLRNSIARCGQDEQVF